MKKVLIIDKHPLFRDFLKQKLDDDQIEVVLTQENRDLYSRLTTVFPNLIILDLDMDSTEEMEFLEKKSEDFSTAEIPVIVTGPTQDKSYIATLAKYGVIKYFTKPVQFDIFFESIGKVLHNPLSIDSTPAVLDIHRNGDLIFIELAQGLNRDKLSLLQFKLTDIIEKEMLEVPKIIIMLTAVNLTFVDGYNLEFLFDNILACPRVHAKNIKVLSLSPFLHDFLDGHFAYSQVEMSSNLPKLMNDLVDTSSASSVSELITDKVLTTSADFGESNAAVDTKFFSDSSAENITDTNKAGSVLSLAIIDADETSRKNLKAIFETIDAECYCYETSKAFLQDFKPEKFNLIILDVLLPDQTGLSLLQYIQKQPKAPPVLVYSQSLPKEVLVKILNAGAKSFMIKPQKPNTIIQKALSILKTT